MESGIELSPSYWSERYQEADIPWDIGYVSTPLKEYIDHLQDQDISVLIPGGGSGYEWAYLQEQGFRSTYLLDWSESLIRRIQDQYPSLPAETLLAEDFFSHRGNYDLILEQTFLCALPPEQREAYMQHMQELLVPGGKLAGVLFDFPLVPEGPPWGGDYDEYRGRLQQFFTLKKLERCYNSIPPRQGKEYFFIAQKSHA
jgi:SAM-dependent methyltransferase